MTNWNSTKEKKIMSKYRFTLTVKIIRVLLAAFLIYALYMMAVNMFFHYRHVDEKNTYYSRVAIDWTKPGFSGGIERHWNEVTPLLTQEINYPIYKLIGKESIYAGEVNISKRIANQFSNTEVKLNDPRKEEAFTFYLPEHPSSGKKLKAEENNEPWEVLEKVHEGTVAQLAFSTDQFMKPEELLKVLGPYDIDVLWMPLLTGEMESFSPTSYSGGGDYLSFNYLFGFTGGRDADDNFLSQSYSYRLTEEYLDESKKLMLNNMDYLIENESKSYYENFLGLSHLIERRDYIKENGFIAYGAVVTGPVKELLKLKEQPEVKAPILGDMHYWNWRKE